MKLDLVNVFLKLEKIAQKIDLLVGQGGSAWKKTTLKKVAKVHAILAFQSWMQAMRILITKKLFSTIPVIPSTLTAKDFVYILGLGTFYFPDLRLLCVLFDQD